MSQPSSSQSSITQRIFVDSAGAPLSIFVDSNGISNDRPSLVRTLRTHGANICADVALARIIIVDPNSNEGRQFVCDWRFDSEKVVLEVAWVYRCLEMGRALLENDAWGGCSNLDGTPLKDDAIHEREGESSAGSNALDGRQSYSSASNRRQAPDWMRSSEDRRSSVLSSPQLTQSEHNGSDMNPQTLQSTSAPLSQMLPVPPLTSNSWQYPPPPPSQVQQLPSIVPPCAPPNGMPSSEQLTPHPYCPVNTDMMMAFIASNPQAQQIIMNMMLMQGMFGHGPFIAAGWPGQPLQGFAQPPHDFQTMQFAHTRYPVAMPPPEVNGQLAGAHTSTQEPFTPLEVKQENLHRSSSPRSASTAMNDSDSDSLPPNQSILLQRGKKRSRESRGQSTSRLAKRSKSPSTSFNKKHTVPSLEALNDHDEVKKDHSSPKEGIFTSKHGEPLTFYVQVQLRNRKDVLNQIKKNGGKINTDLPSSDFIILDDQAGHGKDQVVLERNHWMKVVKDLKRFALRPGFVEACINTKGLVEEDDFIIDPKKTLKSTSASRNPKKASSVGSEERSSPPSQISQARNTNSRSPAPPSGSEVASCRDREIFTPQEDEFALRLAEYLVREDPNISNYKIAAELGERAPRHSAKSWSNRVQRLFRAKFDQLREEALKEKSKGSIIDTTGGSEPEIEEQLISSTEPEIPAAADADALGVGRPNGIGSSHVVRDSTAEQPDLYGVDLKTIVHFFANPPEGMADKDDKLWAAITEMHKCHTAPTWQDFYANNEDAVIKLLREALKILEPKERATNSS